MGRGRAEAGGFWCLVNELSLQAGDPAARLSSCAFPKGIIKVQMVTSSYVSEREPHCSSGCLLEGSKNAFGRALLNCSEI